MSDAGTGLKRCPFCAEEIQAAAIVCKHCGRDLVAKPKPLFEDDEPPKPAINTGLAALLSLILPGAGQMYRGEVLGGIMFLVCTIVGYMLLIFPGIIFHGFSIYHASRPMR